MKQLGVVVPFTAFAEYRTERILS